MSTYGHVLPAFWTRGTGKRLRGDQEAQLVALYLMTCPARTMVGIFHLSLPQLCNDTGLTLEGATKGLVRLSEEAFAFFDEADELFWVPNMTSIQVGESLVATGKNGKPDRRIAGIRRALAPFKGHDFYARFLELYGTAYHLLDLKIEAATKPLPRGYVTAAAIGNDHVGGAGGARPEPEPPPESTALVTCPADLTLPEESIGNLEMTRGVPRWAITKLTADFVGKHRTTPGDKRFLRNWVKGLWTMITGEWSDKSKRDRMKAEHESAEENETDWAAERERADSAERERRREALRGSSPIPTTETQARAALDDITSAGAA